MSSADIQRLAAAHRASELMPIIIEIGAARPFREIAQELNVRGIPTERGGHWHAASVQRLLHRAGWPKGIDLRLGDCREILQQLDWNSVDCCVTSPPYFLARDYGDARQIGGEKSVEKYLAELVSVFRMISRVLKPAGTLWIVIGDSYEKKNRRMIPARLALALQADGWVLRDEIVWAKPRTTPAPVTDRTVAAHEFVYMFCRRPTGYYYDYRALEEPAKTAGATRSYQPGRQKTAGKSGVVPGRRAGTITVGDMRRGRSVWTISPQPSSLDHHAMCPSSLVAACIAAGCPSGGLVLDPFGGAGTTGLAASHLGRRCLLIEISEAYAEMARRRILRGK